MKKIALPLLASALLGACGQTPDASSTGKITNGRVIQETEYPGVVNLYRKNYVNGKAKGAGLCTGTWVAENTIITAAHCTGEGASDENGKVIGLEMTVFEITDHTILPKATRAVTRIVEAYRNKAWESQKGYNRYDLAILKTEAARPDERPRVIVPITSTPAQVKDTVEIVGYGFNNMSTFNKSGDDLKRVGKNEITSISGGFLNIAGALKDAAGGSTGEKSSAGQGDSGGPMLRKGELIGVTSGGGGSGLIFARGEASYVDLLSPESQAFLKAQGL